MQNLDAVIISETDTKQELLEGTECLLEYIKIHDENTTAYTILKYLLHQTIQRINQNQDGLQFTNEAIYKGIIGNKEVEYSSWLQPHWKRLERISLKGLETFAHEKGYKNFAWIDRKVGGGKSNQTQYFLVAKPAIKNTQQFHLKYDVKYIEITNVSPSWWAKILFNQDNSASGWRKMVYVLYPIGEIIVGFILFILCWFLVAFSKNPLNAKDIAIFAFILLIFFYIRYTLINWSRLVEDRIVMASESLMSWNERNVCLELVTTEDKNNKFLRLIKYSSH